jgi:glycosyltransferase involved in cell wall biosynthesis
MDKSKRVLMIGDSLTQSGGIATLQNLILKYSSSDIKFQHITTHDEGSIIYRATVFIKAIGLLVWTLLRGKTDIVHIHISDGGSILRKLIIVLITLMFGKPILMHSHGSVFHINYSKLPKWAQQIVGSIFSKSDGWIALTSFWRDFYITNLGLEEDRVFIVFNPTELPMELPPRINSPQVKIVFLGRVGKRKGTFDLIEAFGKLPDSLKNSSKLFIAGNGELEQARESVEKLNLTEQVILLGLIGAEQRDALLATADVFVLPTYNEGLPLALMEAMGWGLPVITTPVSGIPDIVKAGKNGLLVNPGNSQELSEAMQLLIENEDLRLLLGKSARETVASLDVKSFCCRLSEIYDQVLENNNSLMSLAKQK